VIIAAISVIDWMEGFCPVAYCLSLHIRLGRRIVKMLWTIAVLLLILWLLGMVSSYTLGGFIHILLVLAVIAVLVRVIQGRNPV
jgi:asparagine N-glycosylation enzyme membrane subunit Stt3